MIDVTQFDQEIQHLTERINRMETNKWYALTPELSKQIKDRWIDIHYIIEDDYFSITLNEKHTKVRKDDLRLSNERLPESDT